MKGSGYSAGKEARASGGLRCDAALVVPGGLRREGSRRAGYRGFTVLEVVLAIGIASGLLLGVLYFYRQSADLRDQVMRETDRLSAIRLILDRLTAELRAIPARSFYKPPLSGDSSSLQFIKTDLPPRAGWSGAELGRVALAQTDLRLVKYSLSGSLTNAAGLVRTEEPMVQKRQVQSSNAQPMAVIFEEKPRPAPALLTEELHYLRFRYWDGATWRDTWTSNLLPLGIEVTVGVEPMSSETEEDFFADLFEIETDPESVAGTGGYQGELFRRVIFLPASGSADDLLMEDLLGEPLESSDSMSPEEEFFP